MARPVLKIKYTSKVSGVAYQAYGEIHVGLNLHCTRKEIICIHDKLNINHIVNVLKVSLKWRCCS